MLQFSPKESPDYFNPVKISRANVTITMISQYQTPGRGGADWKAWIDYAMVIDAGPSTQIEEAPWPARHHSYPPKMLYGAGHGIWMCTRLEAMDDCRQTMFQQLDEYLEKYAKDKSTFVFTLTLEASITLEHRLSMGEKVYSHEDTVIGHQNLKTFVAEAQEILLKRASETDNTMLNTALPNPCKVRSYR